MIHLLKKWGKRRHAKHYLKSHWHLILDIILVIVIALLLTTLIVVRYYSVPKVDTTPVEHVAKDTITTTTPGSLIVKTSNSKSNIYSGETFIIKINLENSGKTNISKLELTPRLLSDGFTISKLENINTLSNVKVSGRKLILENLSSDSSENLEIAVTVDNEINSSRIINWRLDAIYQEANETHGSEHSLSSVKLITDLKIKAVAYYNSPLGDQLGSGPIPPIFGLPTNYWIFFEVNNVGNNLNGLAVSAKLPAGVTLSNNKTLSAGEFSYNEGQKRLTWLVKEVGGIDKVYQVGFEIQLMPTIEQINTSPVLVNNISYLATDSYTNERLSGKLEAISTDLPFDIINQGQGVVIK